MDISALIILPITGMIVGLFTNWLAIKLLFFPRRKTFGIQGLIPKRKDKIAEAISESSLNFLPKKIDTLIRVPYIGKKIINYIKKEVSHKVREMDDKNLQKIIENTSKKELMFITISGGVIGFFIGLIQFLILELI